VPVDGGRVAERGEHAGGQVGAGDGESVWQAAAPNWYRSTRYLQLARILRDRLGPLAERVPTQEAPGDELPDLVIHNDRARNELGWRPRPAETTIVETAESLRDLGLLKR
jgi:nucleoside-diphosphate-sugar epimerase